MISTAAYEWLQEENTRLRDDNERLTAVLEQIVKRYETPEDGWPAEDMRAIARAALERKP
jgi:hypothetical protein